MSNDYYQVSAHKVVLSACSDYFREVLEQSKHAQPLLCLDGVGKDQLQNVVDYIYHGEVAIPEENLQKFLEVAQKFQLHGLLVQEDTIGNTKDESSLNDSYGGKIVATVNSASD